MYQLLSYLGAVALGAVVLLGGVALWRRKKRNHSLLVADERGWLSKITELFF